MRVRALARKMTVRIIKVSRRSLRSSFLYRLGLSSLMARADWQSSALMRAISRASSLRALAFLPRAQYSAQIRLGMGDLLQQRDEGGALGWAVRERQERESISRGGSRCLAATFRRAARCCEKCSKIRFTPDARTYRFDGLLSFGKVLARIVPCSLATDLVGPPGIEPGTP